MSSVFAGEPAPIVTSVSVPGSGLHVKLASQVGDPYDARLITKDVQYLWSLGRFDDVRVEEVREGGQVTLTFRATPSRHLVLHEIRIQPDSHGLAPKVPAGTILDGLRVHRIAEEAQRQLTAQGYPNARVDSSVKLLAKGKADLILTVRAGDAVNVRAVYFDGAEKLAGELRALRTQRILPGIPHLWSGWRLRPSYSAEAVNSDAARLRSRLMSRGYLEAQVSSRVELQGKDARVWFHVERGVRYAMDQNLCTSLFAQRREAQKQGSLDFAAKLDTADVDAGPVLDRGRVYHVGRIEFTGNHRYPDRTIRRYLLLDEGSVFDQALLRRSVARLNRTMIFEPIDAASVVVSRDEQNGVADVTIHLAEAGRGSWKLSGPVGPMSLAGPVQAMIGARLPAWGRGMLDLSTYTISASLFAFGHPILPILNAPKAFTPVIALSRPFNPVEGWKSGFVIAPQLGWKNSVIGFGTEQLQQRMAVVLSASRAAEPPLNLTVAGPNTSGTMVCEPPKPRFGLLRAAANVALHLAGSLPVL